MEIKSEPMNWTVFQKARFLKTVITVILATVLNMGCTTALPPWPKYLQQCSVPDSPVAAGQTLEQVLLYALSLPTPFPTATPYDGSPEERQEYLDGFAIGWTHCVSNTVSQSDSSFTSKSSNPKDKGYYAGKEAYAHPLFRFLDTLPGAQQQ